MNALSACKRTSELSDRHATFGDQEPTFPIDAEDRVGSNPGRLAHRRRRASERARRQKVAMRLSLRGNTATGSIPKANVTHARQALRPHSSFDRGANSVEKRRSESQDKRAGENPVAAAVATVVCGRRCHSEECVARFSVQKRRTPSDLPGSFQVTKRIQRQR